MTEPASPRTLYVAGRIRALRKERRMTTETLAQRCTEAGYHLQRSSLGNLETGLRRSVNIDEVYTLAQVLNVPVAALLPPDPHTASPAGPVEVLESVERVLAELRKHLAT